MNEKRYEKKFQFQEKLIKRQSEQIEQLNSQIEKLKLKLEEKDRIIHSVDSLRQELTQNVAEVKKYKEQYNALTQDLRKMKEIINQEVYRGRWKLVRFLLK